MPQELKTKKMRLSRLKPGTVLSEEARASLLVLDGQLTESKAQLERLFGQQAISETEFRDRALLSFQVFLAGSREILIKSPRQ